jgi:hypothetical protein
MRRWAIVALVLLGGCGGGVAVRARVVRPAAVPVRAFPHILVMAERGSENERIAAHLTRHLADGDSRVRRIGADGLAALRRSGGVPPNTIVLRVRTRWVRTTRTTWVRSRASIPCPGLRCLASTPNATLVDVAVLQGRLTLRVEVGATGRTLQVQTVREEEAGDDELRMRLAVIDRLIRRGTRLLDQRAETVRVQLLAVDRVPVEQALQAIEAGDWRRGRALLEAFVDTPTHAALPVSDRARVAYDLGQALRFDGSLPAAERFDAAARWLRRAARLRPERRYAEALDALYAHRQHVEQVRAQQAATSYNFGVGGQTAEPPAVPEVPAAYRR